MKKNIILFLFFVNVYLIYAQKMDTYYSIDNKKFSIGDTLVVGYNSNAQLYKSIKYFYYNNTYDQGYRNVNVNIFAKSFKIISIYKDSKPIFDTSAVVAEVKLLGSINTKYFININEALVNGELILFVNQHWKENKGIALYSDTIAFLFKFKQSVNSKKLLDEYLFKFKSSIYEKYRNDEFELDNQRQIAFSEINKKISNLNDSTVYYIDINFQVGNYDFSSSSFPIKYEGDFVRMDNRFMFYTDVVVNNLVFLNMSNDFLLNVDKKIANGFVKRRKNYRGDVDRRMYARVFITNENINAIENQNFKDEYNKEYIFASIHYIDFYEFENKLYILKQHFK
jgi:hypothetical protein